MKKIKITADLVLKSDLGEITLKNDGDKLVIDISSSSAVIYPLRIYLKLKQYAQLSKHINQKVIVMIENQKVIAIENAKINYLQKWWLFKFILKVITRKGL